MAELEQTDTNGRPALYSRYSPEAWLIACELSDKRSRRKRRQLRRYQFQMHGAILLIILFWAGLLYVLGWLT